MDFKAFFVDFVNFMNLSLGDSFELVIVEIADKIETLASRQNSLFAKDADFSSDLAKFQNTNSSTTNYENIKLGNTEVQRAVFALYDGLLLVVYCDRNTHLAMIKKLQNDIQKLTKNAFGNKIYKTKKEELYPKEYLSQSIMDILYQEAGVDILEINSLSINQKKMIIKKLDKKGIFNIKGAVSEIAILFNTSNPSIYRLLGRVRDEK